MKYKCVIFDYALIEDSSSGVKAAIAGGFDVYPNARDVQNLEEVMGEEAIIFDVMGKLIELLYSEQFKP